MNEQNKCGLRSRSPSHDTSRPSRFARVGPAGNSSCRRAAACVLLAAGMFAGTFQAQATDSGTADALWAWGANSYGQLGVGYNFNGTNVPLRVLGPDGVSPLTGIKAVVGGGVITVVLKDDGTVWTFGRNTYGQLGNGTTNNASLPVQVKNGSGFLSNVTAVAAGIGQTVALKNDGSVWAWGRNDMGQLGNGTKANTNMPVQVTCGASYLSNVTAIACGGLHTIARKSDGTVWTWGRNNLGQLGNGTTSDTNMATQVAGFSGVSNIEAGTYFTLALKTDGTVWTWGDNSRSELGLTIDSMTLGSSNRPTVVVATNGVGTLSNVVAISAGNYHAVALKGDGTVLAWGYNLYGQLGEGDYVSEKSVPVQVVGLGSVSALAGAAGGGSGNRNHTVALKTNGTVWAWGDNQYGQVGPPMAQYKTNLPVQVASLSLITAVAAGGQHTLACEVLPKYAVTYDANGATSGTAPSSPVLVTR